MLASGKYATSDLLKTIELFPKHDTGSNIVGVFLIESSVSKSVAKVDSPQAFLCNFVEVFLRATVISEKFDLYKIYVRHYMTVSGKFWLP